LTTSVHIRPAAPLPPPRAADRSLRGAEPLTQARRRDG